MYALQVSTNPCLFYLPNLKKIQEGEEIGFILRINDKSHLSIIHFKKILFIKTIFDVDI